MQNHILALVLLAFTADAPVGSAAQAPDAAALKQSLDTLAAALRAGDVSVVQPLLDPSFQIGDFTGDIARSILQQVVTSKKVVPASIRVDSVKAEGTHFRVVASFALPAGERTYDMLVTREARFVQINLARVQPTAGGLPPGGGALPGTSLGAAPAAGAAEPTDPALRDQLLAMLKDDQRHRGELQDALKAGADMRSDAMHQLSMKQEDLDRATLARLIEILDTRGWPSNSMVGFDARMAVFLVLQHAPLEVQEKYLPMARDAARAGNLEPSSLAMLEDRVLMGRGQKQRYGTQLKSDPVTRAMSVWPIEDEANVDTRRKAIGLPPLAEYLARFGVKYEPVKRDP